MVCNKQDRMLGDEAAPDTMAEYQKCTAEEIMESHITF